MSVIVLLVGGHILSRAQLLGSQAPPISPPGGHGAVTPLLLGSGMASQPHLLRQRMPCERPRAPRGLSQVQTQAWSCVPRAWKLCDASPCPLPSANPPQAPPLKPQPAPPPAPSSGLCSSVDLDLRASARACSPASAPLVAPSSRHCPSLGTYLLLQAASRLGFLGGPAVGFFGGQPAFRLPIRQRVSCLRPPPPGSGPVLGCLSGGPQWSSAARGLNGGRRKEQGVLSQCGQRQEEGHPPAEGTPRAVLPRNRGWTPPPSAQQTH